MKIISDIVLLQGTIHIYSYIVKWYQKAAEQGNADAQYNLGFCYSNGNGVEQSYEEAVKWYQKAAEQGNAYALERLESIKKQGINRYLLDCTKMGIP